MVNLVNEDAPHAIGPESGDPNPMVKKAGISWNKAQPAYE
jgi:hypothetical protein